jgi:hypothetical protein
LNILNLHINGHAKDLPHNKSEDELDDDDDRLSDDERDEGKVEKFVDPTKQHIT